MKGKAPVVIGSIFIAYLVFVAVVILFYEPKPEDMSWEDRQAYNQSKVTELLLGQTLEQTIETRMLRYRNFGKKSLDEIKEKIEKLGLELGMQLSENLSNALERESARVREEQKPQQEEK